MKTINPDDNLELTKILTECANSECFVIFIGMIPNKGARDEKIDFRYIREKFPFENLNIFQKELAKNIQQDINGEL